jgi:hypothetical protein
MEIYLPTWGCFITVQEVFCARIEGKQRAFVQNTIPAYIIVVTPRLYCS